MYGHLHTKKVILLFYKPENIEMPCHSTFQQEFWSKLEENMIFFGIGEIRLLKLCLVLCQKIIELCTFTFIFMLLKTILIVLRDDLASSNYWHCT